MKRYVIPIARNDLAIALRDPGLVVSLVVLPVVLMAFTKPLLRAALLQQGFASATGAEHVVPGMSTMFAFFLVSFVGYAVLEEHRWNTWTRLRLSGVRPITLIFSKSVAPIAVALAQQVVLLSLGALLFDLRVRGSYALLALVAATLSWCLVALGLAVVAFARSAQQVSVFGSLGAIVFGGIGGAITPVESLPDWARAIAPATPTFWAVRGFRGVYLPNGNPRDVAAAAGVLALMAVAFSLIAVTRMRGAEERPHT